MHHTSAEEQGYRENAIMMTFKGEEESIVLDYFVSGKSKTV